MAKLLIQISVFQVKTENIEVAQKQLQDMNQPIDFADFEMIIMKEKPLFALRKIFGHGSFRGGQQEAIESVLQGNDTIALLPTDGGKTAIYTIASVLLEGVTIVVQPLKEMQKSPRASERMLLARVLLKFR
eukprot:Seg3919.3 transcript_id=Seg3919.3/GoldUCD/mRNA.D3Y31 product="ATP-dependent DNA helicase RecQ" protein_id=Seg3919.3/GoldUCD/D3Y31